MGEARGVRRLVIFLVFYRFAPHPRREAEERSLFALQWIVRARLHPTKRLLGVNHPRDLSHISSWITGIGRLGLEIIQSAHPLLAGAGTEVNQFARLSILQPHSFVHIVTLRIIDTEDQSRKTRELPRPDTKG